MKFLADHNVESVVVLALRQAGFDVASVAERDEQLDDPEVLRWSEQEERILISNDKDFGELAFLQELASVGILLVRLPAATAEFLKDHAVWLRADLLR